MAEDDKHGPVWTFVVSEGSKVLTALLGCLTALVGFLAIRATNQREDLEDSTSGLEQQNEELQEQVDALEDQLDAADEPTSSPTSSPSGNGTSTTTAPEECAEYSDAAIWINPDETAAGTEFVLTVSGSCFEPSERLRIAISEDDDDCNESIGECQVFKDVAAGGDGILQPVEINVGPGLIDGPGTLYVVAQRTGTGSGFRYESQPLHMT